MPPDEANLARIRDNQRRSRARRREYLQELEQRVRAFEEQGAEASAAVQRAARRVADENRQLRALLHHAAGLGPARIDAYLRTGDLAAATAAATPTAARPAGRGPDAAAFTGAYVRQLEQLMVPRFPPPGRGMTPMLAHGGGGSEYYGPRLEGGSPGGDVDTDSTHDAAAAASSSSAVATPPLMTAGTSSRGRGRGRSQRHGQSRGRTTSAGSASSSSRHRHVSVSSAESAAAATTTATTTAGAAAAEHQDDYTDYLASYPYGLSASFYGLDAAATAAAAAGSAEDGPYASAAEPTYFDYSASPHYGATPEPGVGTAAAAAADRTARSHPPLSAAYYAPPGPSSFATGRAAGSSSYDPACPACLSGLGCPVHGFYEE